MTHRTRPEGHRPRRRRCPRWCSTRSDSRAPRGARRLLREETWPPRQHRDASTRAVPPVTSDSRRPEAHEPLPCVMHPSNEGDRPQFARHRRPGRDEQELNCLRPPLDDVAIASVDRHYRRRVTYAQPDHEDPATCPTGDAFLSVARPSTPSIPCSNDCDGHTARLISTPGSALRLTTGLEQIS